MKLLEFQKNAERTFTDLGSLLHNSIHMTMGMATEAMEELPEAILNEDKVNISEELCDSQWYAVNYARIYGIELSDELTNLSDHSETESLRLGMSRLLWASLQLNSQSATDVLNRYIGKILDYDKKEFAYNKKDITVDDKRACLTVILIATEAVANLHEINMDEARLKVINKLKLRYPEKFTQENAINRDVVAERQVLES